MNRFLQPDSSVPNPTDPQEFNRYTYVGNNPLTYYDPGGQFKCKSNSKSITLLAHGLLTCVPNDRRSPA
ncbi:MAG: hypothetical protein JW730_04805 [Anaerolineales bacterium]|nr:hypothetical protein [Anaerolineales bacterium]